jgi:hypothetical protein
MKKANYKREPKKDYTKVDLGNRGERIRETKLYFCEEYRGGKAIGVSNVFKIGAEGSHLTVIIEVEKPFNKEKVELTISKQIEDGNSDLKKIQYRIQKGWDHIYFDKITFKDAGFYKVALLIDDEEIVSNRIEIKLK